MTTFEIFIGLPKCGKSTTISNIQSSMDNSLSIDDFLHNTEQSNLFDPATHLTVLLSDTKMCTMKQESIKFLIRHYFKCSAYKFNFHYFANDPESCIINADGLEEDINQIKIYTKLYKIPTESDILPVHQFINHSKEEINHG